MLHTAACMMRLAQQTDYSGAQSIFLRTLIDKKYTLPHQVVDALVEHFIRLKRNSPIQTLNFACRFESDERELPVLWHQCLLAFVQRYKLVLSDEQNAALVKLTKGRHYHHQISEEVRRELQHAAQQRTAFVKAVKCDHAAMEVF
jgi:essential nuclear protein 1